MAVGSQSTATGNQEPPKTKWSSRYRGATIQDLEPPAAISLTPVDTISWAMQSAFERDLTHLTVLDGRTRSLLGYVSIPALRRDVEAGRLNAADPIAHAMTRFVRGAEQSGGGSNGGDAVADAAMSRGGYKLITMDTPLEVLELFFDGEFHGGEKQQFAVVTDHDRKFVVGVATKEDLEEFVKRRPE